MNRLWIALSALLLGSSSPASIVKSEGVGAEVEIAAALGVTGDESSFGEGSLEGIQLAVEEANAARTSGPAFKLALHDDHSSDEDAKNNAERIAVSPAVLVLGPDLSTASLAAGPIYARAGLASLTTTATSDLITDNATTFRIVFKNSDQGELLATYIRRVLGQTAAAVVALDNGYGRSLLDGFQRAADRLGLQARIFRFTKTEELDRISRDVAAEPGQPPAVLLTLDADGAKMVASLRRLGVTGPILGDDSFGDESFSARLKDAPEERERPGALTDGVFGLSPMILDSANAEIQSFAERFRRRFGHDPIWFSTAGYDAATAAIQTLRTAYVPGMSRDALRAAVLERLEKLTGPADAIPGLLGPLWFDGKRGRQQAIRIGRFVRSRFESAPLQIVPVTTPDTTEQASGTVFEMAPGRFARIQRIIYTGVYLNEVPRIDLTRSSFGADFYVWLRYARSAGPDSPDPAELTFPNLLTGDFAPGRPAERREMPDGTEYRLWRVQGEFRNDFDLRRYPFDSQRLSLSFFNTRAAADRIVYVIDRRSAPATTAPASVPASPGGSGDTGSGDLRGASAAVPLPAEATMSQIASPVAFRNLTQWAPVRAAAQRENLVTNSALGDPSRSVAESFRELSGFKVTFDIRRRALATVTKSLLPLGLMTLIMFASLFFPHALVKEKITIAITAALSGAVLMTAINAQLGAVGYTIAVEYVFYVFFGLSVMCVVSVLAAERLRVAQRAAAAVAAEQWTRIAFVALIAFVAAAAATIS